MMKSWQEDVCSLVIAHRLLHRNEVIPADVKNTPYAFVEPILQKMHQVGLLVVDPEDKVFKPTQKLSGVYDSVEQMLDILDIFEVFSCVHLDRELTPKESENGIDVLAHISDPRFLEVEDDEELLGYADLRLASLQYLSKQPGANTFEIHRIVALYLLQDERFDSDKIWNEIQTGEIFSEIESLLEESVAWEELADSSDEAALIMEEIIKAGFIEAHKRDNELPNISGPRDLEILAFPILIPPNPYQL